MEILVLAKQVPETAEADLEITRDGAEVEREDLVYTINEWDNYAVEEAVRLKEAHGGAVTVLTLGDEEAEDVLRRGLAMGCDQAIHLGDEAFMGSDPAGVVRAMVKALGADPTPIAFGELYMALQQKVVDGMECPVVLIHDMKFYEVQKYMVLDGHLYNPLFVFINDKFFSGLTPEQQKIVAEAAKVLAKTHDGFSQQANIEGLGKLKAKGMEIHTPTKEQMAQFRSVAQPAGLEFIKKEAGEQWVAEALAAAAEAEAKVGDKAEAIVADTIKMANDKYLAIKK
jgi:hypothetical protein